LCAWLSACARGQDVPTSGASAETIARWIADLDSQEYRTRETASRNLAAAASAALDPLLTAANGERLESAERAIAILQQQARAEDEAAALAALQRLVQLRNRPQIVQKAESEVARLTVAACKRHLEARGAECRLIQELVSGGYVPIFRVRLGAKWHGTPDDFRTLANLQFQPYVRLEGAAIDDAVIKVFETTTTIMVLQVWQGKVSVAAVDSLKKQRPHISVNLRNRAFMGVGCDTHAAGARITLVEPGSGADAAGVVAGDVITSMNGNAIPDFDRLTANVAQYAPGEQITVDILRGEERRSLKVTFGDWELRQPH
jgi:hypothetical protein